MIIKNVLIVDDNIADIYLTKEVLEESAYNLALKVFEAKDGETGLNIVETESIDLIMLDIKMPKMNGFEMLKILKEKYPNIVVIMLTTSDYDKDIMDSYNLKADAYIVKPIDTNDFEKKIQTVNNIYLQRYFEFINFKK